MGSHRVSYISRTGVLLALALIFQIGFRIFAQPVVGPLVNMTLIISASLVGTLSGVVIGCLTPLIAFMAGIMPLFPLVPFIMIGNILYVVAFNLLFRRKINSGDIYGVILASLVKFGFLAFSIRYLLVFFIPKVPPKLIAAFSLPQLYTGLIGGFLAIFIIKLMTNAQKSRGYNRKF